jgi:hypothetical protein
MRDPLDELENFTNPGLTMDPLPVAEVRRRGTRMRRRNNALAAIGGVAAVAIIATPLAMAATGNRTDTTPPVTTQPPSPTQSVTQSVTWKREIPADFPIADGMPEGTTVDKIPAPTGLVVCGTEAGTTLTPSGSRRSLASASFEEGPEGTEVRTIALFPDDSAAIAATAALEDLVAGCTTDPNGTGDTLLNELGPGSLGGDASYVVTQQAQDSDGVLSQLTTMEVVRTGNAVYVVSSFTSAGGQQVVDGEVQRLAESSAPVIDAMCIFSADPC